jgi:hypothetical protein
MVCVVLDVFDVCLVFDVRWAIWVFDVLRVLDGRGFVLVHVGVNGVDLHLDLFPEFLFCFFDVLRFLIV